MIRLCKLWIRRGKHPTWYNKSKEKKKTIVFHEIQTHGEIDAKHNGIIDWFYLCCDKGKRKTIRTGNYLFRRRSTYIDHNKREIVNMQEQQKKMCNDIYVFDVVNAFSDFMMIHFCFVVLLISIMKRNVLLISRDKSHRNVIFFSQCLTIICFPHISNTCK